MQFRRLWGVIAVSFFLPYLGKGPVLVTPALVFCPEVITVSTFAARFYSSPAWKQCRDAFRKSRGKLCERCLARGIINAGTKENPLQVHHKIPITPDNIDDPAITLNWDNLETLCQQCHAAEHIDSLRQREHHSKRRWKIGENGEVLIRSQ